MTPIGSLDPDRLTKLQNLLLQAFELAEAQSVRDHISEAISLLSRQSYTPETASQYSLSGHYLIPDYPKYTIDRMGRIFGLHRRRLLKPWASLSGHLRVDIRNAKNEQKKPYVHDLVAATFLGPKPSGAIVRHLNDDPSDNRVENLVYGSQSENTADSIKNGRNRQKFSEKDVQEILRLHASGLTSVDLRELYPCSSRTMTKILTGSMHPSHGK